MRYYINRRFCLVLLACIIMPLVLDALFASFTVATHDYATDLSMLGFSILLLGAGLGGSSLALFLAGWLKGKGGNYKQYLNISAGALLFYTVLVALLENFSQQGLIEVMPQPLHLSLFGPIINVLITALLFALVFIPFARIKTPI